jgi:mRNA-degrading endonuclease RelE of RelBE toxin-antitoxin system
MYLVENTPKYQIRFAKKARKDITELTEQQKTKLKQILEQVLAINPHSGKALKGKLKGLNSYRLNRKDRILYEIYEKDQIVLIITFGVIDFVPQLPLTLLNRDRSVEVFGLLDTGASVNVLPYDVGIRLGAVWEEQTTSVRLGGNLALTEAKGIVLSARISDFSAVKLVFAWSRSNDVPVLLGRTNFFQEFDVCFYTSLQQFELTQE